jgi:hypothetical protein
MWPTKPPLVESPEREVLMATDERQLLMTVGVLLPEPVLQTSPTNPAMNLPLDSSLPETWRFLMVEPRV